MICHGRSVFLLVPENKATVVEGVRKIRIEGNGFSEVVGGLFQVSLIVVHQTTAIISFRIFGIECNSLFQVNKRLSIISCFARSHAKVKELFGRGMVWLWLFSRHILLNNFLLGRSG